MMTPADLEEHSDFNRDFLNEPRHHPQVTPIVVEGVTYPPARANQVLAPVAAAAPRPAAGGWAHPQQPAPVCRRGDRPAS